MALVAIPQSLAYAELAGLPVELGLFAAAIPAIAAAIFVSSKQLQTGPVALTALLVFGALSPIAEPRSSEYLQLAALLALMVGVIQVALGLLGGGRIASLLSEPVLLGFSTGAATLIVASQIPRVLDIEPGDGTVITEAVSALLMPGDWSPSAILISVAVAATMVIGRRLHPLFPGVLVAVLAALIFSRTADYQGTTIGELSGEFLSLQTSLPWESFGQLISPAVIIALVSFTNPAAIARKFATEDREDWNANQEFVSQGVANFASGLSGAFPVGGSFGRSSLNRQAGATSRWAGAITGLFVLIAIPFTPQLEALPSAVLGAIVIVAVAKLIEIGRILRVFRESRGQAMVALGTLVATLASAPQVQWGVLAGILLAVAAHLVRELRVTAPVRVENDRLIVSPQGVLWFATVPAMDETLRAQFVAHPDIDHIEVDLSGVGRLDYSGALALSRIAADFKEQGTRVEFTNIPAGAARAAGVHLSDRS